MSLTSEERRRLDEIDRELSRQDPRLCRVLSDGRHPRRRCLRTGGKWLTLAALPTLIIGAATGEAAVCVVAWLALFIGAATLFSPYLDLAPR
jgi:hypothetical protein